MDILLFWIYTLLLIHTGGKNHLLLSDVDDDDDEIIMITIATWGPCLEHHKMLHPFVYHLSHESAMGTILLPCLLYHANHF